MIRTLLSLPESSPRYSHFLNLIFLFLNLLHVTLYSSIFSFSLFLFLFLNLLLFFLSFIFLFLTFSSLVRSGLLSAFEHPVTVVHSTLYALQWTEMRDMRQQREIAAKPPSRIRWVIWGSRMKSYIKMGSWARRIAKTTKLTFNCCHCGQGESLTSYGVCEKRMERIGVQRLLGVPVAQLL